MHVDAKSALQELTTMKKRCNRADMRFPIEKLVAFPPLNVYIGTVYIYHVYLIICIRDNNSTSK